MSVVNISPNMLLPVPVPTLTTGPEWAQDIYACLYSQIDAHDHSSGKGVQVPVAGLNINGDLTFQTHSATNLLTTSFVSQVSPLSTATYPLALYTVGSELWYNDNVGHQVQLTNGGTVNVVSSGISDGSGAKAAFVSKVLVVNSAASTPGNIQAGSLLMGNNNTGGHFLTLSPPTLSTNYTLTLPGDPGSLGATKFMTLDTSGNIGTASNISGAQIANGTIIGGSSQIAQGTITNYNLAVTAYAQANPIAFSTSTVSSPGDIIVTTPDITATGRRFIQLTCVPVSSTSLVAQIALFATSAMGLFATFVLQRSTDAGTSYQTVASFQQGSNLYNTAPIAMAPSTLNFLDTTVNFATTVRYRYRAYISNAANSAILDISNVKFIVNEI